MVTHHIVKLVHWYDRYLWPLAFLTGFTIDSITLTRADLLYDNLVLIAHLTISAFGIVLTNAHSSGRLKLGAAEKVSWLFPLMMQFSFGALFSGFIVLYARSGSFASSWLFLALLFILLVGNEFFRGRYRLIAFHFSVYFTALYAYSIFAVPIILNRISAGTFLISGAVALVFSALFAAGLGFVTPRELREGWKALAISVGTIFAAFNILYFTNIIPPIPLALKRLGIYHAVQRVDGVYRTAFEPPGRREFFRNESSVFAWQPGEAVYAGSAVFAPTEINTGILHIWMRYDADSGKWKENDRMSFAIIGGRDEGYRGYTFKYDISPGKWRVEVRTQRGQLLGRTTFDIIETAGKPELREGTL